MLADTASHLYAHSHCTSQSQTSQYTNVCARPWTKKKVAPLRKRKLWASLWETLPLTPTWHLPPPYPPHPHATAPTVPTVLTLSPPTGSTVGEGGGLRVKKWYPPHVVGLGHDSHF